MVVAAHLIFSCYGFWLPNDPRGSWSDFVGAWELLRFGRATKVDTHKSVAHASHNRALRMEAKRALKHPPVLFTGPQAHAVGTGFARTVVEADYTILACSILPDHVHLVVEAQVRPFERIVSHLKANATRELKRRGIHPLGAATSESSIPTPWAEGLWKVYADTVRDVERMIDYVERNPEKERKPKQTWNFVRSFKV